MNENISNLFEKFNIDKDKISPEMINNILGMLDSNKEQEATSKFNASQTNNIDMETIMKMKSIIDKMNAKDDPRSNLLNSLRPYLNENRKSKIDQYIQLMNVSRVMEVFKEKDARKQ